MNLTARVVDRIVVRERRRGVVDQCEAWHGYVGGPWVAQPAQNYL